MEEIWRDIKNYEGFYQVSNTEKVKSLERTVKCPKGFRYLKEKILKQHITAGGYYSVDLCKDGKSWPYGVHCLVAQAFPEICGKWFEGAVVNHKDENKLNNKPENLEYIDWKSNLIYGTAQKRNHTSSKKVYQYTLEGDYVNEFESTVAASNYTGIFQASIAKAARGFQNTAGGFIWKYA